MAVESNPNHQRPRKTNRITKKTNRYGRRTSTINKNLLFEAISSDVQVNRVENFADDSDSDHSSIDRVAVCSKGKSQVSTVRIGDSNDGHDDPQAKFQSLVLSSLGEIKARLDLLEKDQIDGIVARRLSDDASESSVTRNFDSLAEHGLPATTKEDLDNLEFELMKSNVKQTLVCSLFFAFNINTTHCEYFKQLIQHSM